ncbi:hypothetical protein CLV63_11210 [Murinocardiopsis flavida]|uniref:Uncharacterized protein n=1 Tax=Murinocardiopsis flavida TaxID=645275 RepID=A0A2P8DFZ6_9ACTN|nr:hypothetical protein [Murinocardiopsis flavida]PSK96128.1 hypothetical protein CLV63_11210 [Murinocardiopsis flavida]
MHTADAPARARILAQIHALAGFLHARPDLPVHDLATFDLCYFPGGDDEAREAEVERIADLLQAPVVREDGHTTCEHRIGAAAYRVVAISDEARARHRALATYAPNIRPD